MPKQTHVIEIKWSTIWRVIGAWLIIASVIRLRSLIFYLLFATLFAVALSPFISWLQIKGLRRNSALALAMALFVGGIFLLAGVVTASLIDSVTSFVKDLPSYIESLRQYDFLENYVDEAIQGIQQIDVNTVVKNGITNGSSLLSGVSKAFEAILFTFFFTVYMLLEKDYLMRIGKSALPKRWSKHSKDFEQEFIDVVGNYIRGHLLTSFLMGLVSYIIFRILGLPNALALGIIAGLTDVIPVVGGLIGLIPAVLVAFTIGPFSALLTVILVQSYSTFSNYFVRPKIFGKALDMSPFIVTVATMIGLLLFGIPGIILALPAAAMIGYVLTEYYDIPVIEEDNG